MSSLRDKEKSKEQQEKFQAILSALLKDEDNKYCVDCDAKGPRWASWNLGIFLCIRCAGIHRNLGVHISKVKSVNLDTWQPEQIAMMQEMGNSRARAVYEANIPDGFRRPQTDSALEAFIRAKYENKKYIAREWIPPRPKVPKEYNSSGWLEDSKAEKKRARAKAAGNMQIPSIPKVSEKSASAEAPRQVASKPEPVKAEPAAPAPSNDLLGLDLGTAQPTNVQQTAAPVVTQSNELLELFGAPQPASSQPAAQPQPTAAAAAGGELMQNGSSGDSSNLFGVDGGSGEEKKSAKDSIMALFGGSGGGGGGMAQPQMYGVPGPGMYYYSYLQTGGVYMPQGQQQMFPQQGMMGQPQQGMMGQPQQGMMGQPPGMMGQPQAPMMGQQSMMGQPQPPMMGQSQGMMGQQQGMMGQPQGMMGQPQQGMMGQGMMGQQQGMMGQQQGMMGQPQGMMGQQGMARPQQGMMGQQQTMNGAQPGMFNGQNQMMGANQAMYNPQQMQQLQFQQMQQQMTNMKLSGAQMGTMPQQAMPGAAATSWGAQSSGHTLSNNLWQ